MTEQPGDAGDPAEEGRLTFRPRPATGPSGGQDRPLRIGAARDGVLYVPDTAESRAPVILFFHGAGGTGRRELRAVLAAADRFGAVVAAPDSREATWDVIALQRFGPDVRFADQVLDAVADQCDVDFDRLAIGGISDGASYALCLGVTNGDLFPSIVAFSPGFNVSLGAVGKPRVFISHGTHDKVLPIDMCGRRIAAELDYAGYPVTFHEFDGGHTVPPPIADLGFGWWVDPPE
jgi:phospholipase/carboxylesterase